MIKISRPVDHPALPMTKTETVDWFRVVEDVCRRGHTLATISVAIDVPRTTIIGWRQGATPKHPDGERMLALWREVMIPPLPVAHVVHRVHERSR
jgi:hypothetical protein